MFNHGFEEPGGKEAPLPSWARTREKLGERDSSASVLSEYPQEHSNPLVLSLSSIQLNNGNLYSAFSRALRVHLYRLLQQSHARTCNPFTKTLYSRGW